jgi:sugar lactone lactonase YvrE
MLKKRLYHLFVLVILSAIITLFIATADANQAPIAQNQSATTNEDTSKAITLVATDADTNPLTYTIVSGPSHGTLTGTPPRVTYKPAANYNGADSFTFKANDGTVDSNIATVSITVVAVNDAPVAKNQSVSTNRNTAKAITLVATDADGDPLTYQVVAQPAHGTLNGTPPSVTYTPSVGYSGSDSFTFKANDGKIDSNVATVSITVVNHAPVAKTQSVSTNKNTAKAITLVATDADNDPLTYQIVVQPAHGTLSGTPPGVTYTPVGGYSGSDSFTFKANDGKTDSNIAAVSITVVNHTPVAQTQSVSTNKNTAKAITLVATDADKDPLTYQIVAQPAHGTLSGTAPGVTYTPSVGYSGSDSFTFKVNDGIIDSNVATVSITVVNRVPVAQNQSLSTNKNTVKAITLVATDADGDLLTYQVVAQPTHSTLNGTPPSVTYTPAAGYSGSDSFTFKANDGKVDSNVATVSITVVNHAPVAQNQSASTNEDTAKAILLAATDVDSDTLTYAIVAQPGHGTLSGTPPSVTYKPAAHYYGSDGFTFKANDGKADSNVATVSITVTHVNHAPVAQDQSVTTGKNMAKAIVLVATDADNDPLTYKLVSGPLYGSLSGTAPNITYVPNGVYSGSDSLAFKANDGKTDSNRATVSITVVDNAPITQSQSVTTNEDTPLAITLVAMDPDGDKLTYAIVAQPIHGALSGTPPSVIYTPGTHYYGSDSFTFKANDGKLDSNLATISISVVKAAPVAQDQTVTAGVNKPTTILLSATNISGDALTFQVITQPVHGTLTGTPPKVTYTPASYYNGPDSFTFRAYDGQVYSNLATVSITVIPLIITVAGNGIRGYCGDGGPATEAMLAVPSNVAVDVSRNLYIVDQNNYRIRMVDAKGIITTVAGNGSHGYGGDGGPATQAMLAPAGIATDASGNLYIADGGNGRVRKVDTKGIIMTVAGNGSYGYGGDGGPATEAMLGPVSIAIDASGNLYIADIDNHRVRMVGTNGIITTVAGGGNPLVGLGDGGPAIEAKLRYPNGVAVDASGNLYIADTGNYLIRKVDLNGVITTVAGGGRTPNHLGDGGPATEAELDRPEGVSVDTSGNLYIADSDNHRIRKVAPDGIITTVAGNGSGGYGGDEGLATKALLYYPTGVVADGSGNLYIADGSNLRVRKVDTRGIITSIAGNGSDSYGGDNGIATDANLDHPSDVVTDASGNFYIADSQNNRIRRVDRSGIITTVAGNGIGGYGGDGGPATKAMLSNPSGVAIDPSGKLYIADSDNHRIRMVAPDGIITTVGGNGSEGYGGDGGPAIKAMLDEPFDLAVDTSGNIYIADSYNGRIRKVDNNGIITTVAGNGSYDFGGDGGPAIKAMLDEPSGVAVDASGNLYIADTGNYLIRKVDLNGVITTVAGNGNRGEGGDSGPAILAELNSPASVVVDASGNLYIADTGNYVIRKVDVKGIITTVAGGGMPPDDLGDGGPATEAEFEYPEGVTVDASGNLYIADTGNDRIRKVEAIFVPTTATIAGKVTDLHTTLPLPDVMATIKDSHITYDTKTASDGSYMISGLSQGNFTATFMKSGYTQQSANGTSTAGQTQILDIRLIESVPIQPLSLNIASPQDGATVNSSPVLVTGNVNNNANVTVNGFQASVTNNAFSLSVLLSEGSNTLTAVATDQYGQAASQKITVTLVTRGSITGTVKDSSTGLPLPSATVSVTELFSVAKSALTDNNGKYMISGIAPETFNGSISKGGYTTYNFSGTMGPGQAQTIDAALSPILPIIWGIFVINIPIGSATITWITDQPTDSFAEYGTTPSYGSSVRDSTLTASHTIKLANLTPATIYHFRVISTNGYGFSSSSGDLIFMSSNPLINLVITFPSDGAVIKGKSTMVKGTVINSMGNETGVTVNGKVASAHGNDFVANHVPLADGSNMIIATATDAHGNTQASSITVNSAPSGDYVEITAIPESGISPFESTLTINSSLALTNTQLIDTGPAQVEYLSTSASQYRVRMTAAGTYHFTATVKDMNNNLYQDTIAITVLLKSDLDNLLRAKWEAMRAKLAGGDIEGALVSFDESTKQEYRDLFEVLSTMLATVAHDLSDVQLVEFTGDAAIYDIRTTRDGTECSFQLLFTKDATGIWGINSF